VNDILDDHTARAHWTDERNHSRFSSIGKDKWLYQASGSSGKALQRENHYRVKQRRLDGWGATKHTCVRLGKLHPTMEKVNE